MSKSKTIFKVIAAFTAVTFVAQGTLFAEVATLRQSFSDDEVRKVSELRADPGSLLVSSAAASVIEHHTGTSQKILIHIQDAHTNLGAQKNLATVLDEIITQYGVDLVFVEGGTGNDSLSFLREYSNPETRRRTASRFLEKGEISGEEYLDIVSDPGKPFLLWGIEDPSLYEKSLVSYARIVDVRRAANAYLDRIAHAVRAVRPRIYPRELLGFEKKAAEFRKARTPFTDYHAYLADAAATNGVNLSDHPDFVRLAEIRELENTVDFKKADAQQGEIVKILARHEPILAELAQGTDKLKFGRTPLVAFYETLERRMREHAVDVSAYPDLGAYLRYVRAFGALDMKQLLKDFEAVEDSFYARHADKPDVRRLHEIARYADILRNYYSLKLKPSEFEVYKQNVKNFQSSEWIAFLNRKLTDFGRHGELIAFDPVLDERQSEVAGFYRTIESRDHAFVDRAFAKMEETGRNAAVLICGGYHTPHLKELLKEKQSSYVVVTPHVAEETDIENYERVLLGSLDPTKRWVVTAREGTVRPRRAAELRAVVPEVQSQLIRNDGLYKKPFAEAVRSLENLRTAADVVHKGRFRFSLDADEAAGTVRVYPSEGPAFVLRPGAPERRLFDTDLERPAFVPDAAAAGTRAADSSPEERYQILKDRWTETSSHGNRTDIFLTMARVKLDQGDYKSAVLSAIVAYKVATEPGHDSIPVSLVISAMHIRDITLKYLMEEAREAFAAGSEDKPEKYALALDIAFFVADLWRLANDEYNIPSVMPEEVAQDAARIRDAARERLLNIQLNGISQRFRGTLSHGQHARRLLEQAKAYFEHRQPQQATYLARAAIAKAIEPGHDSIPGDAVTGANDLIERIKERYPESEGARLPPQIAVRIEDVIRGSAAAPGLMQMAQDRAFVRSGAQDELISAVSALLTAVTDGRSAETAFVDLAAAGVFLDRAGNSLRGDADAVQNLQSHAGAVKRILIDLSIALGDLDDPVLEFKAPNPAGLAWSSVGRLYVLLQRVRRLLADQSPGILPTQVLKNVLAYPDIPVTPSNRDNQNWGDDFTTDIEQFVLSALSFIHERELIDEGDYTILNQAIEAELKAVYDSYSDASVASLAFVFGHLEGSMLRIGDELRVGTHPHGLPRARFELDLNELYDDHVRGIAALMPILIKRDGGDAPEIANLLTRIGTALKLIAVYARQKLLTQSEVLTHIRPFAREKLQERILQVSKTAMSALQIVEALQAAMPDGARAAEFSEEAVERDLLPLALDAAAGIGVPAAGKPNTVLIALDDGVSLKIIVSALEDRSLHVEAFSSQPGFQDRLLKVVNVSPQSHAERREALKQKTALAKVQNGPAAGTAVATALETAGADRETREQVRIARTDYLAVTRAVSRDLEAIQVNESAPVVVTVPLEAFKEFADFAEGRNYDALLKLFLLEAAHVRTQGFGANVSFAPDTRDAALLARALRVIEALKAELAEKARTDAELSEQWLELAAPLDAIAADLERGVATDDATVVNIFNAAQTGRPVIGDINIPVILNAAGARAGKSGMEVPPLRAILRLGILMARAGLSAARPQDIPRGILNAWQTLLGEPIAPKDAAEFGGVILGLVTDAAKILRFALPPAVRVDFDSLFQFIDAIARFA